MDNQTSDLGAIPTDAGSAYNLTDLPQRIPGEAMAYPGAAMAGETVQCQNAPQFGRCADTTCMICYADMPYTLPELPDSVKAVMTEGPSDIDLLNRRLASLEKQLTAMDEDNKAAFQYLCQSMQWLVNMLSGVAQLAQNMPGMGGMMARMLKGGK